jgi:hypothetical protein
MNEKRVGKTNFGVLNDFSSASAFSLKALSPFAKVFKTRSFHDFFEGFDGSKTNKQTNKQNKTKQNKRSINKTRFYEI